MFGSDGSPIVQYVVIFAVIFTALAAIVFTVRRLTGRSLALPGRTGNRGRQPRLGIVDVYELDRARQLILLRRDNVEHLLLVGGPNDVVVERNIQRGQRPLPEASIRPDPEALDEPLPDPLVQGGRLPEPPRALPEMTGLRSEPLFDPGFEMPVVVPSPVPRSGSAPSITLPLDPALLSGDEPGQDVFAPVSPVPPPPPKVAEPPPAPLREPVAPRRILSRTAPPLVDPRPSPASARASEPAPAGIRAAPPAPALAVPSERRTVDPAILSDMARQLQAALARPASAVTPAPPPSAPTPPAEGIDPVAAAMASAPPVEPAPPPEPVPAPPLPMVDPPVPPAAPAAPAAPPIPPMVRREVPPAEVASPPAPTPVPPAPQPAPKAPPAFRPPPPTEPPRPEAKTAGNPFSVEEIEAEFARLLGRPLDKRS
ncbi:hypothetical protein [Methylobacterium phyllostachyos]|uniref:hypothetical protein n=1 Tax=Methylobacterium phyllostachyos TaxID=582672 RepID=UPI001FCE0C34|nr:hypothetical protein [Methylobacterium phyllostachyos]